MAPSWLDFVWLCRNFKTLGSTENLKKLNISSVLFCSSKILFQDYLTLLTCLTSCDLFIPT